MTAKRAFEGETITETLAKILEGEPDWDGLPKTVPSTIRFLLSRCLQKDPNRRLQHIDGARILVDEVLTGSTTAESAIGLGGAVQPALWKRVIPWSLTGLTILIAGLMLWILRPTTSTSTSQALVRFVTALPADLQVGSQGRGIVALSRDGAHLAYVATQGGTAQLYLRSMDQLEAQPIPGSEGAVHPLFSPNGQWIGFFAGGKLKKVSVGGGAPVILCDVYSPGVTADWGSDDTIRFAQPTTVIYQVPAAGGTPQAVTTFDSNKGERAHFSPHLLPDGNTLLFTALSAEGGEIVVQSLATGERKIVLEGAVGARYVPSGHLVYAQAGTLMAVAFDLDQLEVRGAPIPILEGVMQAGGADSRAHLAFSDTGTLVYIPSQVDSRQERTLVWVNRQGLAEPLAAPPRPYYDLRLSPDSQRVIVESRGPTGPDLWLLNDVRRETLSRLTFQGGYFPLWTPDGKRMTFQSQRLGGAAKLFWKAADGTGTAEQLSEGELSHTAHSWSPGGPWLAFSERSPASGPDILLLPLEGERTPQPFLRTPANETGPVFSPDGRWLAYRSNESGRNEVYVQPFPATGAKWQISTEGGEEVMWARSGEIFYRNGDRMMAVEITTEPIFSHGTPQLLFEETYLYNGRRAVYDVTPDGQKFLMIKLGEQRVAELNVILNWFEELKRLVPTDN